MEPCTYKPCAFCVQSGRISGLASWLLPGFRCDGVSSLVSRLVLIRLLHVTMVYHHVCNDVTSGCLVAGHQWDFPPHRDVTPRGYYGTTRLHAISFCSCWIIPCEVRNVAVGRQRLDWSPSLPLDGALSVDFGTDI
jgi:hypothetical protein